MKRTKQFLSVLLALMMIISIIPMASIEAEAYSYSSNAASQYALTYWEEYNPNYSNYNSIGGDCANFVSQCLYAGGLPMTDGWYWYSYSNRSSSWTVCSYLKSYLVDVLGCEFIEYPDSSQIDVGDVLYYNNGSHVGICSEIINGTPWVCAHNYDRHTSNWKLGYSTYAVIKLGGGTVSHQIDSKYGTNFTAYPKVKITAENIFNANHNMISSTAWIGTSDKCTIHEVFTDGCCKVSYPLDDGGTKTVYSKISLFKTQNTLSIRYDANGGTIAGSDKTYNVYKVASSAGVNLRSGAGTSYDTLLTIPKGGSFVVTATTIANGYTWGKTTYNSKTGWCVISEDWTTKTGTQPQTKYHLNSSDVVYKSSTGKVFTQKMVDGTTYSSGLYNYTTFGISRTGYTFKGWGTKASGGTVYSQSESMTAKKLCSTIDDGSKTITLYAIWEPNVLSVYFNANGGSITSDTYSLSGNTIYKNGTKCVQDWTYNSAKTNGLANASTFGLSKKGYTFVGWGTKASGGTIFDQNDTGLLPTEINSNLKTGNCSTTLYAIWKANTYTVKYNANGGTGTMSNSSHTYGTSKALTANAFKRTGYTFLGWSTSSTATTAKYTDKQSVKNLTSTNGGTVTLYAVWSQNEHTPGTWTVVTAATCTTDGLTRQRCTVCGEMIAEKELPATGHTESNWSIVTEATCTTEGVQQKTCTVCGEIIEKEEISELGHTETEWITEIEPTCTEDGLKYEKCLACGEIIDKEEISVIDHIHGEWETILEATCVEAGYKIQPCINCGETLATEEILATGHIAGEWETVTESSCVTSGSKVQKCTVCGVTLATDGTSSFGHTAGNWEIVKNPSCTTTGMQIKKCTVCNETLETVEILATGHIAGDWEIVTNASCTENGLKVQNCTECGETLATEELAAAEHTKGDWEVVTQPTCVLTGLRVQSCVECGETISTEEIPTTEHIGGSWKVAINSTCSAIGFKIKQCSECGEVLETEEIPKKEHTFANGSCLICNETDSSDVPDTNFTFSIQEPSRTEIRNKDGIILHANVEGTAPAGSYVVWTSNNSNFDEDADTNDLTVIAKNKGYTTFTATLYDADGNVLATDSVELYSKSGFFDKIGGFFRSLFGSTKIYEN